MVKLHIASCLLLNLTISSSRPVFSIQACTGSPASPQLIVFHILFYSRTFNRRCEGLAANIHLLQIHSQRYFYKEWRTRQISLLDITFAHQFAGLPGNWSWFCCLNRDGKVEMGWGEKGESKGALQVLKQSLFFNLKYLHTYIHISDASKGPDKSGLTTRLKTMNHIFKTPPPPPNFNSITSFLVVRRSLGRGA